ncbi:hypothetical protein Hanom_Chr02g00137931 [Helianthus anomalus]
MPVTTTRPPIHYTPSKLNPKIIETHEAADSSDSDDLFEENETTILMRRITVLKEDKIFKDAQIASLMEELVVKNRR